MAAKEHYLTDVVTAAAVGSVIGWTVPYLFHRPRRQPFEHAALVPAPGGIAIAW